ncbi:MAG TPA: hypothetical protein VFP39_02740 [Gemmatimonadales bacterium]|nr:hypothetical protein [Gemmatimonadales bacterium]
MRLAALLLALGPATQRQSPAAWTVTPPSPTVGDTIRLERTFSLPAGWRVRPGRLEASEQVEPLEDARVVPDGSDWVVRYIVVAWAPGVQHVAVPPVWRLGARGEADSVPGGTATFTVASVIPDSVNAPQPKPALTPIRAEQRAFFPLFVALLVAGSSLSAAIWWRRRPVRVPPAPPASRPAAAMSDERWLQIGEPKAVAARAAGMLRTVLARVVPEAHGGLSTAECLAVAKKHRPAPQFAQLEVVLGALDAVAFGSGAAADVATLAQRARMLAQELKPQERKPVGANA